MTIKSETTPRSTLTSPLASVAALLVSVAILVMGNGLQSTLLPVRASLEDFGAFEIGLMGSAYYLGFVLGCLQGGKLIARAGHIRAFTALASIASTTALVHAVALEPVSWIVLRAITGFCFAGLYLVIETWLNDKADNQNRGFVMGAYTMVNLSMLVIGQLMLTLSEPQRFPLFAFASILISLAAVPVALTTSPQPAPATFVKVRLLRLYQLTPVGLIGACLVGTVTGAFWTLGPAYAAEIDANTGEIALFMAIASLGGALTQWPLGRLSDRLDRRIVLIAACAIGAIAATGITIFGARGGAGLFMLAFVFGAAALPLYAICAAHAFDFVSREDFVETSSGLLLIYGAGSIAGPLLASVMIQIIGPAGLFTTTAFVLVFLAAFSLWRITQRAIPPDPDRTEFDLVTTAPTMVALDPEETSNPGPPASQ
jgi:MFS family permease